MRTAPVLIAMFFMAALTCCNDGLDREVDTDIVDLPIDEEKGVDREKIPEISFVDTVFEAGKITQGEFIYHTFSFTNTGKAPLVISNVDGSCGCTIPRSYPRQQIMPGEGGEIEVEYNSDGKWGTQVISVIVSANTVPAATQLLIKTEVVAPDNMKKNN